MLHNTMIDITTSKEAHQSYYYTEDEKGAHITVAAMDDLRYEYLLGIRALVEYCVVKLEGTTISLVNDYGGDPEIPQAPHFIANQVAEVVTRLCCFAFGVLWKDYQNAVVEWEKERKEAWEITSTN